LGFSNKNYYFLNTSYPFSNIISLTFNNIMEKSTMILTSPDFEPFGKIPDRFTCEGENVNPTLKISNIPSGAKSFALIVDDVDAITPEGPWVHWVIWNIDSDITTIEENSVPPNSVQGKNSSGIIGWSGPCPPPTQPHHYRFMLFALDDKLNLPEGSSKFDLQKAIEGKILADAELIGEYQRIAE